MQVRWERIVGAVLIVVSIWLFYRLAPLMERLLEVANEPRDSHPIQALMLGVMCLAVVAGIKLLVTRKGQ